MLTPIRHSLITEAADSLRSAIASGEFQDFLPGVRTLSQKLTVSIPTILEAVRILAKEGHVEVKQGRPTRLVADAKTKMRESLRKEAFFLIFYPMALEEVSIRDAVDCLRAQGYSVKTQLFGSWRFSQAELERLVAQNQVQCWVLAGSPPEVQKFFANKQLPCLVACGIAHEGLALPDFEMDFSAIYRHVAHQFLNHGHRNFHLILPERSAQKNPESLNAFVSAVQERLPDRGAGQLIKTYDGTVAQLKALIKTLFSAKEKPTGLCVAFVSRYILAQAWLLSEGYQIPKDVSLICRDGDHLMECLIPSPSHYTYRMKLYSRRMARAVIAIMESRRVKTHTLLVPEFIKGDSLGPPPR